MIVSERYVGAGLAHDLTDGDAFVAALGEEFLGGVEDPVTGLLLLFCFLPDGHALFLLLVPQRWRAPGTVPEARLKFNERSTNIQRSLNFWLPSLIGVPVGGGNIEWPGLRQNLCCCLTSLRSTQNT